MNTIRIGVVGIGFGQHVHIPVFRGILDCEISAVCARAQDKAERVARRLGIERAFGDWRLMIEDASINVVTIAVPPVLQPEIALAAMAAGKAVFCEKPLAISVDRAAEMVAAAQHKGLPNVVDFEFPEIPAWRQAKDILENSVIGEIRHFAVNWNVETYAVKMGLDTWKRRAPEGGGALFSFVSHVLYNLEWLVGPVQALTCQCPRFSTGDLTFIAMTIELQSGAVGSISVSSDAFLGSGQRWELYGTSETVILSNETADYIKGFQLRYGSRSSGRLDEIHIEARSEPSTDGRITAVAPIARRFIDWVRGGPTTLPDFSAGLRVQQLLDAALQSQVQGRRIQCSPFLDVGRTSPCPSQ